MVPANASFDLYHTTRASGTDKHDLTAYATKVKGLLMPASTEILALDTEGTPASELWTIRFDGNPGLKMADKIVDASDASRVFIVTGRRITATRYLPNVQVTVRQKWGT